MVTATVLSVGGRPVQVLPTTVLRSPKYLLYHTRVTTTVPNDFGSVNKSESGTNSHDDETAAIIHSKCSEFPTI